MSSNHYIEIQTYTQDNTSAKDMPPGIRQEIGVAAIANKRNISNLSHKHSTSRKFVYSQKAKAESALENAFSEKPDDENVLFHIPVTKQWLEQVMLELILVCHSSYQGVIEFFRDILDRHTCKGTIFNVAHNTLAKALDINRSQDLSSIKVGAHDEIFQGKTPVLTGCDVESTYVYLLKAEEHRDMETWGVRLLELSDQGMKLDHTIADGGNALRSGQREAWPDVSCWGDVFHPLYDMGKLVTFLENRAAIAIETVEKLEAKMAKSKKKKQGTKHSRHLGHARKSMEAAVQLRDDMSTLLNWLHNDILSVTGPDFKNRQELLTFVVDELKSKEYLSSHRIRPVRRLLERQGKEILCFSQVIDKELQQLSQVHQVPLSLVRKLFELYGIPKEKNAYWEGIELLRKEIGERFYGIDNDVQKIIDNTVRASSIVENLNSRLRNYFFLRKTVGNDYLELLQFFLNHRRFMRSMRPERIGKSPKELLTGDSHDHWLELLGYDLFKKSRLSSTVSQQAA